MSESACVVENQLTNDSKRKDDDFVHLLRQYVIEMARQGKLGLCERLIYHSRPVLEVSKSDRIIQDPEMLIEIALDCMYASPSVNQWDLMNRIFLSLPARDSSNEKQSAQYQALQDRLDEFELHLLASEILSKYNIAPPLQFYRRMDISSSSSDCDNKDLASFQENVKKLLLKLFYQQSSVRSWNASNFLNQLSSSSAMETSLETFSKGHYLRKEESSSLANDDYDDDDDEHRLRNVLQDVLLLREKVFYSFLSEDWCYASFVGSLLRSAIPQRIQLAQQYLNYFSNAEDIIIDVVKEYFNSAASVEDSAMQLAKQVLSIAPSTSMRISEELNLAYPREDIKLPKVEKSLYLHEIRVFPYCTSQGFFIWFVQQKAIH